jgi:uncharacterized protein YqhQ
MFVLGYDFPLLSLALFLLLLFVFGEILFAVLWAFIDNFRRRDHHGWAKAGWAILILLLPLFGTIIYMVARPPGAADSL